MCYILRHRDFLNLNNLVIFEVVSGPIMALLNGLHYESKNKKTELLLITFQDVNRFSLTNSVVNLQQIYLNIPPHLKCVATLPSEICVQKITILKK